VLSNESTELLPGRRLQRLVVGACLDPLGVQLLQGHPLRALGATLVHPLNVIRRCVDACPKNDSFDIGVEVCILGTERVPCLQGALEYDFRSYRGDCMGVQPFATPPVT
jgi:hypothetical protein